MRRRGEERITADVGLLLRQYRRAAALTQEALAERAGYSTVYISMLERGQRIPLGTTLAHLADALGLSAHRREALLQAVAEKGRRREGLVGRTRELTLLERHLSADGTDVLAFAGEPGIGKSRLLREAGERGTADGWQVLAAGCTRRGGQEPHAPLPEAVATVLRGRSDDERAAALEGCIWLAPLLPELVVESRVPLTLLPAQERRLVIAALRRFLANVRGPRGTLLLLDDIHWAGADALDLLAGLLGAASDAPLRVIIAYRSTEIRSGSALSGLLADLAREGALTHCALGPLSWEEASQFVEHLVESVPTADRERLIRGSGGVPFFLVSFSQALRSGDTPQPGIPWDLAQSIRERIAGLSLPAQDALSVAAVAGRRAPQAVLAAALLDHLLELPGVLEEVCMAGLLEEEEDGNYRFSHDVIREVVEGELSAARRTALHRRVADVLEVRPGGSAPGVLAYHYARSDDDEKALHYLARAGEVAFLQHAHTAAEGYYRELIDRLESLGRHVEAAEARERFGHILSMAGRYEEALIALDVVVVAYGAMNDREGVGRVVADIGRIHYLRGTAGEGIDRLVPLREIFSDGKTPHALAALNAALAPLFLSQRRYTEQLTAATQAAELARAICDDRLLIEAEVWRGCALSQLGRREEGRAVQEEVIALAEARGDVVSLTHALNDVGFAYEHDGYFDRSRSYKGRALALAERVGDPASIANMSFRCGQNALLRGDRDGAQSFFLRARDILRELGPSALSPYPDFGLGLLALAAGEVAMARTYGEDSLQAARDRNDRQAERAAAALLAELDLREGRPETAVSRLQPLAGESEGLELYSVESALAEAFWHVGEVTEACRWAAWSVRQAEAHGNRIALVEGLRVQALTSQDPVEGERLGRKAVSLAQAMGYPVGEARAQATLSTIVANAGRAGQDKQAASISN